MFEPSVNRAYLGLGSNIEPERNLPAAVRELARYGRVLAVSKVWESAPIGFLDQPNFLNAAALLETRYSCRALREEVIPQIERKLERRRDPQNVNAPRTIDVDILLFNRESLELGSCQIPSPEIHERPFVAIPLAELDPDYIHPETAQTLRSIAAKFDPLPSTMRVRGDVSLGQ